MKKIKIIEEGILNTHDMLEIKGGGKAPICTTNRCIDGFTTMQCINRLLGCGGYISCWNNGLMRTCNVLSKYYTKDPL